MALPELDTSAISWISYWNFNDRSPSDIDPQDTLGVMESYNVYSNGVDGVVQESYRNKPNRLVNVRVKDDGWIIAWFDRRESYDTQIPYGTNTKGHYDILDDWTQENSNNDVNNHRLEKVIQSLYNSLSNSTDAVFSYDDVGTYGYMWPDATNITITSQENNFGTFTFDTIVIEGTNIHGYYITGSSNEVAAYWNGTQLVSGGTFAAIDRTATTSPDTPYTSSGENSNNKKVSEMIVWS